MASACTQLGISQVTGVDIYNFLREVCSTALLREPVLLGGPGRIDESLFCHKCKYHRGRVPVAETWVFGMVACSTSLATGFVQIVERRNAVTFYRSSRWCILMNGGHIIKSAIFLGWKTGL